MNPRKEIRIERTCVANGTKAYDVGVATYQDKLLDHYEVTGRYLTLESARTAARQVWDKEGHHVAIIEIPDVEAWNLKESKTTFKDMLDALTKQLNNGDLDQLTAENAKKFADLMRMAKEEAKARPVPQQKPSGLLTAICVMNLGREELFDVGASYVVELLPDKDMLLATDKSGKQVEVMKERFRLDDFLAALVSPVLDPVQMQAIEEVAAGLEKLKSLQKDGRNHQRIADAALKLEQIIESLSKGEPAKAGPKTNFEVQIESKIKELDEKIEKLLAVVGKYDKLKNPDMVKEYRDALADLDPLLNEREKLLVDESRFKVRKAGYP